MVVTPVAFRPAPGRRLLHHDYQTNETGRAVRWHPQPKRSRLTALAVANRHLGLLALALD